jgi:hypothetical protein
MKIEQCPLTEYVGCHAYFDTNTERRWIIRSAYETLIDSEGSHKVNYTLIRLSPVLRQKSRLDPFKQKKRYRSLLIVPDEIVGITMEDGLVRYQLMHETLTVLRVIFNKGFSFAA